MLDAQNFQSLAHLEKQIFAIFHDCKYSVYSITYNVAFCHYDNGIATSQHSGIIAMMIVRVKSS